uniref:hypothetical protein n=1 Tax=Saccharothrix mutabilis TaxID=33921 RepID=UPI0031E08193
MSAPLFRAAPDAGAADRGTTVRVARAVSATAALAIAVCAIAGLLSPVYRDPDEIVALFRAYDAVALAAAVLLLVVALFARSVHAVLLWAGMLAYAAYNYAYYLFGARLNALFGLYAAVVALSVTGLVALLLATDNRVIAARYRRRTPVRAVAVVLAVLAVSLGAMWLTRIAAAVSGQTPLSEPSKLVVPAAFTQLGAAVDLAVLVPAYGAVAVALWRGVAWAYPAATALLLAGVLHQVAYMVALVVQASTGIAGATAFDPLEPVIAGAFLAAATVMLWHREKRSAAGE